MIVENPDAFKAWLKTILEPLCDADPEALAKYVFALVKKDKPVEELRKCMVAQLEVFLADETTAFVDFLISKLQSGLSEEYAKFVQVNEDPQNPAIPAPLPPKDIPTPHSPLYSPPLHLKIEMQSAPQDVVNNAPTLAPTDGEVLAEEVVAGANQPEKDQVAEVDSPTKLRNGSFGSVASFNQERISSSRERKSESERESVRRWGSSGSPPPRRVERSRSRSWEHRSVLRRSRSKSRRSRSRGRERDRSRAWRNKSPPSRSRYERDRKRSWSKSPPRSRSRTPPTTKGRYSRYRNRSPFYRSRSRSHSPFESPHKSNNLSGATTPTRESNHSEELRLSGGIQSVVSVKESSSTKSRCRDYDEKGFCVKGDFCPFDHGKDPVVLEDVGQLLSFSAPGVSSSAGLEPAASGITPMMQPALGSGLPLHHRPQLVNRPPTNISEYNPDTPSMGPRMWNKRPFHSQGTGRGLAAAMRGPQVFLGHQQRELINVPMEGKEMPFYGPIADPIHTLKRPCPPEFSNNMEHAPKQKFDYSRLGSRRGNCSLQLKKVPVDLNNIANLHNHFMKFGKIVNIQVRFEGDLEGALITFTSHAEASAAYKSTEAVLNNRFIKVFWHNPDKDKQENVSPLNRTSAKERLGAPIMNVSNVSNKQETNNEVEKVLMSGSNITKTVYMPTERKLVKPDPKKLIITTNFQNSQEVLITRENQKKKLEEKRKTALKLTQQICKKKHDLIQELLGHQKQLIDKLERRNVTPEQRTEILKAIKGFQENIGVVLHKDITSAPSSQVKVSPQFVRKTREETQKQILDAELDLFKQQQEGKDTSELQKHVLELRTKAHNLGLLANNGVIRLSRGGARFHSGRGRGSYNLHSTVDHRPTKLLVSGFESDDKADVLEHFSKFGEVVDHVWDEATPALVIQFKTRKDAETAMAKGRNFQDRLMSVTWFSTAQSIGMRGAGVRSVILLNDNVADLLSEHDDEEEALRINLESNEDFLLQDEEEEEDEERSWRR